MSVLRSRKSQMDELTALAEFARQLDAARRARDRAVVSAYRSGLPVKPDIQEVTGLSRSTIYEILAQAGIKPDRRTGR